MRLKDSMALVCTALLALIASTFIIIPQVSYPAEDAAILYQFSDNLWHTGVISYNANGQRAEGATDFLWMAILSGLNIFSTETFTTACLLSLAGLFATAYLLLIQSENRSLSRFTLLSLLLFLLPPTCAALQGFSPLFFGALIALACHYFLKGNSRAFLLTGLIVCLVRPDGFVFIAPLIIFHLALHDDQLKQRAINAVLYFVIPGTIYFLWRWQYFGEFLPLPFYVKSSFERYAVIFNYSSLYNNIRILVGTFWPTILVSGFLLLKLRLPSKPMAILLATVVLPFIFYSCMSLSQNVSQRFQYAMMLGLLITAATLHHHIHNRRLIALIIAIQITVLIPRSASEFLDLFEVPSEQGTYIAKSLNNITTDARMLVTEAGRLPYYSKWKTIDSWGLNSPQYTKRLIQPEDVREFEADLIVVHAKNDDYTYMKDLSLSARNERSWENMCFNISKAIDTTSYELIMIPFLNSQIDNPLITITAKLKKSLPGIVEDLKPLRAPRYDAYFVRLNETHTDSIRKLLISHSGISFEEYAQQMNTL